MGRDWTSVWLKGVGEGVEIRKGVKLDTNGDLENMKSSKCYFYDVNKRKGNSFTTTFIKKRELSRCCSSLVSKFLQ
jgi:hypothetical protein